MLNTIKAKKDEIIAGIVCVMLFVGMMTLMIKLDNHMNCVADNITAGHRVCSK